MILIGMVCTLSTGFESIIYRKTRLRQHGGPINENNNRRKSPLIKKLASLLKAHCTFVLGYKLKDAT